MDCPQLVLQVFEDWMNGYPTSHEALDLMPVLQGLSSDGYEPPDDLFVQDADPPGDSTKAGAAAKASKVPKVQTAKARATSAPPSGSPRGASSSSHGPDPRADPHGKIFTGAWDAPVLVGADGIIWHNDLYVSGKLPGADRRRWCPDKPYTRIKDRIRPPIAGAVSDAMDERLQSIETDTAPEFSGGERGSRWDRCATTLERLPN